ncbi:MAG: 50S ribosomal protein L11 methyltransferase [Chitinophagaceae bacterium]|nr:MAG: 50S ribosomal protein L11 methyltransferase [Chitinophagaceae bacterium]
MTNYISVHFKSIPAQSEMITALLMDMGFEAAEEQDHETIISIKEDQFDEPALKEVMEFFGVTYSLATVAQQNWNAQWESSFEPVIVDDFALIRASFHAEKAAVKHDIIITPKMSFGTGHHATTFLMIQLMRDIDFASRQVIDFGTGTGVLAILAEKLGAANILGIDNDEWSINNGQENIAANNSQHIQLEMANEMLHHEKADIILANINLNVIVANLVKIRAACKENATVLFSGLMTADEPIIEPHLTAAGFHIKRIEHRNGWIALLTIFSFSPALN